MTLFRSEAVEHRTRRLYGDVQIILPLSWQVIGCFLFAVLVLACGFITLASYARFEAVQGLIVPDSGLSTIVATRPGILMALDIATGSEVKEGAPLASINSEDVGAAGVSNQTKIADSVQGRLKLISTREAAARNAAAEDRARQLEWIKGLRQEAGQLQEQITMQRTLATTAQQDVRRAIELSNQGFVSTKDLQSREEALTLRLQQLSSLEQQYSAKTSAVAAAQRGLAKSKEDLNVDLATLAADHAQLAQSLIGTESSRAYSLTSPVDGRVATVSGHVGQSVVTGQPIMVITPAGSKLVAELYLSSDAIGFIATGQPIRVAVDAFPYERYGTLAGTVKSVATAPILRQDASGSAKPIYLVVAEIQASQVMAFGDARPLLPGMTINARIEIRRQSLFRWLFEPLFAVRHR